VSAEQGQVAGVSADDPLSGAPSNWGRWGADDERGTLNYITPEVRLSAVAMAVTGEVVSLAARVTPLSLTGVLSFGSAPTPPGISQLLTTMGPVQRAMTDVLVINSHHASLTHIDAVVHVPVDGKVYPGVDLDEAVSFGLVQHGSTRGFGDGIVTRGVFLDLAPGGRLDPGFSVTRDVLERAADKAGAEVRSGDALVVRGGWQIEEGLSAPIPAVTLDAVEWMHEREVSVWAGDIGDPPPFPAGRIMPLHMVALPRLGMPLIDNAKLDELSRVSQDLGRWTFLFVAATLAVDGATGLPVNPLAIF